jgi:multiple sugar transport system ATP-binding protein
VRRAKAFMMDEPLGALDSELRHLMCTELRGLHERIGATTVYVTHDQIEAMAMADRIAVMKHGVVDQIGSPQEVYDRPLTMHVAGFIGSPPMNFLHFSGALAAGQSQIRINGDSVTIPALREGVADSAFALGVRPEDIRLTTEGGIRGEIFGAEYMGTLQIVTVNTAHGRIKARIPSATTVRPGETVGMHFDSKRLIVFNRDSGRALRSELFAEKAHGSG